MNIMLPRMAAMLVILMAIPLVVFAFRWAMADMNAYPVRYAIERWQSQEEVVTLVALDKAIVNVDTALGWSADNAEYHELKAHLLSHRGFLLIEQDSEQGKDQSDDSFEYNIRHALALHESAIQLRPHWPYSWANKSLMKAYLGEFDETFSTAVERAAKYGSWELSANLAVLEAGLIGWRQLGPASRLGVVAAAERATEHHFKAVHLLLDDYTLRYPICAEMKRTPQQQKLCQ